ncbi:MAG TPA: polysaccharide biosynthesis tyrosine autokinase [Bryobacteraceae bacterium]|nr:polysaccharide biosynthesis tyrosine autokinase [Bryobacteraceae bacterium]
MQKPEPQFPPDDRPLTAITPFPPIHPFDASDGGIELDYGRLLRRYGLMALLLVILGGIGGFLSIAVMTPKYEAKALLEVRQQNVLPKTVQEAWAGELEDLFTEAQIAVGHAVLQRVVQRLELENLPAGPRTPDVFSKMRRLLGVVDSAYVPPEFSLDPTDVEHAPRPLAQALQTLKARVVDNTHLIEISCQSTDPQFAAAFVNLVADEYIQQNYQARADNMRVSTQWISSQLKESKEKLLDSENRLDDFNRKSGNLFAARESTLAESKLQELQEKISSAESDLIPKRARYELVRRTSPEALAGLLDDAGLHNYELRLNDLRGQESSLLTTLQPAHPKVQKVKAEIEELEADRRKQINTAVQRITSEYQQAQRELDLLKKAYATATSQVIGQSKTQSQHQALEHETESARTVYQGMLRSANEAAVVASAPLHLIQTIDGAVPPRKPVSPKPPVNVGAGAAGGLALGVGLAWLLEMKDRKLKSPRDASYYLPARRLGAIPSVMGIGIRERLTNPISGQPLGQPEILLRLPEAADSLRPSDLPQAQITESFRLTVASLMRGSEGMRGRSIILVTSPEPREGKTTIAGNLGLALAETGRRVLLVDADFRRPRAHLLFGVDNRNGLVELLEGSAPVESYPKSELGLPTPFPNLSILPNGRQARNIAQQINSPRLLDLLDRLRQEFDFVVIDAPPVLPVADARILGGIADGVVLVLRSGVTDRESALEALECLRTNGAAILGTVLNDWRLSRAEAQKYQYYSSQDSQE